MYTQIILLLLLEEQLHCLSFCLHHLEVVLFGNHKGVKGNPKGVNRFLDCDVILAMVRKPDFSVFDKNKLPDIRFQTHAKRQLQAMYHNIPIFSDIDLCKHRSDFLLSVYSKL